MKNNKKKIAVLSIMTVLLVVSAVLNVWLNTKLTKRQETLTTNTHEPTVTETFKSFRSSRETTRQELIDYLDAIISSESASASAKTAAENYTEEQYQALRDVLAYAKDEEKTEREFFVEGINCNPLTARDQFVSVKQAYGKEEGIQAYHGYLSFKEQDISPELAQKIGMEFVNEVWGKRFQAVVTTHLNTKHLHCHYVINSVSFVDGKRLWGDEKAWFKFRLVADKICE